MNVQLLIDMLIVLLLIPTIIYAFLLNKKITFLQKNKDDMMKLIVALNDATSKAEMGMPKLKSIADKAITSLQEGINKTDNIKDDLSFLIEKADTMADKLEGRIKANRNSNVSNLEATQSYSSNVNKEEFIIEEKENFVEEKTVTENDLSEKSFENKSAHFVGDDRSEAELELLKALRSMR